jgi:KaiC/GvpD/RAD55 family RecA-like ATPase
MERFISASPLKLLERSSRKGLGPGNLGVLIARAGVGKTACLIHIAFDRIFHGEKLVHVSLDETPEKVTSYYNVILYDLVKALDMEDEYEVRGRIDRNRLILAYLNQSFSLERLENNLGNLEKNMGFKPDTLIVDGMDCKEASRDLFGQFKQFAESLETEIWFSALSHRHITETNERGIPYPCHQVDDLFSIILQLQPETTGMHLRLLKDHDHPSISDVSLKLDPGTFLVMEKG